MNYLVIFLSMLSMIEHGDTPKLEYEPTVDFENSSYILQREFTTAQCKDVSDPKSQITTGGLTGCIFVSFYNPGTKQALAAHLDDDTRLSSLFDSLNNFVEKTNAEYSNIEVSLVGGWKNNANFDFSQYMGDSVIEESKRLGITKIDTSRLYLKETPASEIHFIRAFSLGQHKPFAMFSAGFDTCAGQAWYSDSQAPSANARRMTSKYADSITNCRTPSVKGDFDSGCKLRYYRH